VSPAAVATASVGGRLAAPGRTLAGDELAAFAGDLARDEDRWRHLVRHVDEARVHELIWNDADVSAWVICWSAGQDTGFHDHSESAGGIHVVDGSIAEERLGVSRPSARRSFGSGERFHVPSYVIHRVFHEGGGPAVSIHAYSPPLVTMGDYRFGPDGQLERRTRSCALPARTQQTQSDGSA
jgi:cysteine dioxygenase type I